MVSVSRDLWFFGEEESFSTHGDNESRVQFFGKKSTPGTRVSSSTCRKEEAAGLEGKRKESPPE